MKKPELMLAKRATFEELQEWNQREWEDHFIEPKIDGVRFVRYHNEWMSRQGKKFHNVDDIVKAINSIKGINNYLVDGELSGIDWSHSVSFARSFRKKPEGKIFYKIFDLVNLSKPDIPLYDRKEKMVEMFEKLKHPSIVMVASTTVSFFNDFQQLFNDHTASGCDGAMIKLRRGPYEFKRSKYWLKVKPYQELDCKIVNFNEGRGKYVGTLGSIEVVVPLPGRSNWSKLSSAVSGMEDSDRDFIWKNRKKLLGKIAEVKFRKVSDKDRLIEPRLIRLRPDKEAD